MSFDREALARTVAREGRTARIVIAGKAGSVPREPGTAMLVWAAGQAGTIGGGALEYSAAAAARAALATGDRLDRVPLGPGIGQCCGGAVTLLTEVWDEARIAALPPGPVVRPVPGAGPAMPLRVAHRLRDARSGARVLVPEMVDGWMIEPETAPRRQVWIWGAGHVGRALVAVLGPLPGLSITWVDVAEARFPAEPDGAARRIAANPADLAGEAPREAEHLIVTHSHALDLELCHRLLARGFSGCGLIGSATKWARFGSRLRALGHSDAAIACITCPIGNPALGKHPQAIAIGVAAALLTEKHKKNQGGEAEGERDSAAGH